MTETETTLERRAATLQAEEEKEGSESSSESESVESESMSENDRRSKIELEPRSEGSDAFVPIPDQLKTTMAMELDSDINDGHESVTTHITTEMARQFKSTKSRIADQ